MSWRTLTSSSARSSWPCKRLQERAYSLIICATASPQPLIAEGAAEQAKHLFKLYASFGKAPLVESVALDQMLFEGTCGPLTELDATLGFDAIADGDDHVQTVVINL